LRGNATIVVVDDDDLVCDVATRILEAAGFDVLAFVDPNEALRTLGSARDVHVLLTDSRMPQLDGLTLASLALRKHPRLQIIVSSGTPEPHQLAAQPWGARARLLVKPWLPADLLAAVDEALRRGA
jgi:two-component system cell cycle response regulator CpdR